MYFEEVSREKEAGEKKAIQVILSVPRGGKRERGRRRQGKGKKIKQYLISLCVDVTEERRKEKGGY